MGAIGLDGAGNVAVSNDTGNIALLTREQTTSAAPANMATIAPQGDQPPADPRRNLLHLCRRRTRGGGDRIARAGGASGHCGSC